MQSDASNKQRDKQIYRNLKQTDKLMDRVRDRSDIIQSDVNKTWLTTEKKTLNAMKFPVLGY